MYTQEVFDIGYGRFFLDGLAMGLTVWICASVDYDDFLKKHDVTWDLFLVMIQLVAAVAAWSGNLYYFYQTALRRNAKHDFVLSSGWRVLLLAVLARDICVFTLTILIGGHAAYLNHLYVILFGAVLRNLLIVMLNVSIEIAAGHGVCTALLGSIIDIVVLQLQFVTVSLRLLLLGRLLPPNNTLLPAFVSCRRTHMLRAFLRVPETMQSAVDRAQEIKARESFMRQRLLTMAVVDHEEPRRAPNRRTTARGTPHRIGGFVLMVLIGLTLLSETIICYWFVPNGSTYYHGVCVILTLSLVVAGLALLHLRDECRVMRLVLGTPLAYVVHDAAAMSRLIDEYFYGDALHDPSRALTSAMTPGVLPDAFVCSLVGSYVTLHDIGGDDLDGADCRRLGLTRVDDVNVARCLSDVMVEPLDAPGGLSVDGSTGTTSDAIITVFADIETMVNAVAVALRMKRQATLNTQASDVDPTGDMWLYGETIYRDQFVVRFIDPAHGLTITTASPVIVTRFHCRRCR